MTTPFRRRPDDDDDDDERPDSSRRPGRPADDDADNPPASGQRAGSSGWVPPRFNADRAPARDSSSNDDFGFIKDRIGDRRTSPPPKDDDDEDEGSGLGGFMRRGKKPEDDQPSRPPLRSAPGERPAAPAGRFSPPGGSRDKPDPNKGGDEPHKSRLGGILGRGSKDKDDKDSSSDRSSARRSPFLGGSGDSSSPGGSPLRDSQRRPGTSPLPGSRDRQPPGSDDSARSGPPSRVDTFRDRTGSPDRSVSPFDRDRAPAGDRATSPYERDRAGSPDRPTSGLDRDRPGAPGRTGISPDRTGSPLDRDRSPGGDRPPSTFDRDRAGAGRPGAPPDRTGSPLDRDRTGAGRPGAPPDRTGSPLDRGRPDALRDRDQAGASPSRPDAGGSRDWPRRESGGDIPPRSASQTRSFPARPGSGKDEKKDEPHKSRLGGLLGRGSKDKDKDKDRNRSKSAAAPARPGTAPGARPGQTSSGIRPSVGGSTGPTTDARGRGSITSAPSTPDAKRRSQLTPAARDTDRSLPGGRRGVPEPKSRAATPPVSSRTLAKPLPGKEKGAFSLEQGLDYERKIDLIGVALLGFALVTFFAVIPSLSLGLLPEAKQGLTGALNHLLAQMFGWGKIVWPIVAGGLGIWLMRASFAERGFELNFFRVIGMVMLYTCALTWLQMFELIKHTAPTVEAFKPLSYDLAIKQGQGGGWLGHTIYMFLLGQLLDWGTVSVLLAWLVMSLMLTFDLSLVELWGYVARVFSVFTVTEEQRTRKRAAREALAAEVMTAMRPGEAAVLTGAALAAGEIATTPVRSTIRQAPAATDLAQPTPGKRSMVTSRATPGSPESTSPSLAGRLPAVEGETPALVGETTPDRSQPGLFDAPQSPSRPGPVINRRVGMPTSDAAPETPEEEPKTGDEALPLTARRRLPHFRGTTEETDAVSGADAGLAETPKVEETDASRRRFGGLFRRGGDQPGDQPATSTTEVDKPASSDAAADKSLTANAPAAPGDPLARRSPFARPAPDDAGASPRPGIPVPPRASTPSASAPDAGENENKPAGFGRFRRASPDEDAAPSKPADSTAKEDEDSLSGFGRFRRAPTGTAAETPASPSGDSPEAESSGLGRFRRGGSAATTETPAVSPNEGETPAKSENLLSGFNRLRRKPETDAPAASSPGDEALTQETSNADPSDQGDQAGRGRFGRLLPGLRRSGGSEPEAKVSETPASPADSGEKAGATPAPAESKADAGPSFRPSALPAEASPLRDRPSPFDSALRPSRTESSPDTPDDSSAPRPETPTMRRSPDLMNLAPMAESAPLSPARRPVPALGDVDDTDDEDGVDDAEDDVKDTRSEDDKKEDRPGLGTLAALGAAGAAVGAAGAAALLDRNENRREDPDAEANPPERIGSSPVRAETDTPESPRSPFSGIGRPAPSMTRPPAFTLDDPLDAETKPATSDDSPLPAGEKPAQPARPDLLQRRPLFGDRLRSEPAQPATPPPAQAGDAAITDPLPPARPVGIDPLRRSSLTAPLRSSENSTAGDAGPGEVGATAPIQAPGALRRSPLIAPDSPPVKDESPTVEPDLNAAPPLEPRPSPFADLPARPAPPDTSSGPERSSPPAPALPARPAVMPPVRPAGTLTPDAQPGPSATPPLSRPVPRPLGTPEPPVRPAPLDQDDDEGDEDNDFDDDDFEEVEDENGNGSATPSVLGTRSASPDNIPTGRPSIVRRGASTDRPLLPPKPAATSPLIKREPVAAVGAGANAPESRSTARTKSRYDPPDFRTLLRRGDEKRINDEILLDKARVIEDTLVSFGAPGKVVEVNPGPVITQFGIEPDYVQGRQGRKMRVKVGAIARLDADLALALAAKSIRIEAPVPGKGFVGIEVPNDEVALVGLYDIMDSPEFRRIDSRLRIALGLGVDGSPVAADLTAMPHLLIAGTTGSGKSVCVNSIIACLLLENTPQDVQFIMVDPKRVELTGYNGIPHLVAPVVVDLERIVGVLQWVQREMEERYRKFAAITARNILDYNTKIGPDGQKIPYYVVVVDELADLMMLAPDETERLLARLAQMARATGIHLIISTQRPSVDIITGLIKANFPARIAFAVASSVDSRVILDQPGAEKLLGRGDMLYQSPDAAAPLRMQGAFVSDEEINRITSYWKTLVLQKADAAGGRDVLASPSRDLAVSRAALDDDSSSRRKPAGSPGQHAFWDEDEGGAGATDGESKGDDELYQEAVDLVQRLGKASISLLQRRLRIGYTRSAKMIDMMEEDGIVGPAESGSKPREVIKLKGKRGDDEDVE